jgi:hypothetical protein
MAVGKDSKAYGLIKQISILDDKVSSLTAVGDIPNRYTSDVVLNQQARVAHQGGMADSSYRAAQLLKPTWRYWTQALMADPETGPWRTTGD